MTSLLAGTLDHRVRGSRGLSGSYGRNSLELPGTLRNSPVVALTTIYGIQSNRGTGLLKNQIKSNSCILFTPLQLHEDS